MNQRISYLASVAEIFSGVAVVVTLIVLIVGVRENTEVTRASVYVALTDDVNALVADMYRDPELSRVWTAFLNGTTGNLDTHDADRLRLVINTMWRNYEKAYFSREYDVLGEVEWNRFIQAMCINYERVKAFNRATGQDVIEGRTGSLTAEFRSYFLEACGS